MEPLPNGQILLSLNVVPSNIYSARVIPTISVANVNEYPINIYLWFYVIFLILQKKKYFFEVLKRKEVSFKWTYTLNNPPANGSSTTATGSLAVTNMGI